ncbi:MAG: hypothetical protein U0575_13415 [Phycisphaerales bacterium]
MITYERRSERLAPRSIFLRRLAWSALVGLVLVMISLAIGT